MNKRNDHYRYSGFTLVELSIVLVILGLLVGGVLSGQALIHAAELRSVTREFTNYQTAVHTFKDKYFALPGDMSNAVRYWGSAVADAPETGPDAGCTAIFLAAPADQTTCNGDGNGMIGNGMQFQEYNRAWQHLSNAGLIEGNYSGAWNMTGAQQPGLNIPASRYNRIGWGWSAGLVTMANANKFNVNYRNALIFGNPNGTAYIPSTAAIRAEDALTIDMKMDDGRPHTGSILSFRNALRPACINEDDDAYLLTDQTNGCTLIFMTGF